MNASDVSKFAKACNVVSDEMEQMYNFCHRNLGRLESSKGEAKCDCCKQVISELASVKKCLTSSKDSLFNELTLLLDIAITLSLEKRGLVNDTRILALLLLQESDKSNGDLYECYL